eukprot:scpid88204/ scgid0211/ Iduronate 2-sulfatase; Alpha-L-iduronate sulfate sulfatase; Iduronate 2-sulfatase 42 kDa chain; Iduronate 2-sulfatase 14 kDa chain
MLTEAGVPVVLLLFCSVLGRHAVLGETTNVLFIVVDDLRPELQVYGYPRVRSSNIADFAKTATLFRSAYCQFPLCAPSRTSFLTGRRPATTKVFDLTTYFRDVPGMEDAVTLPQFFKNQGYTVSGAGKIFHQGSSSGDNDPISWTEPYYLSPNKGKFGGTSISWQARDDDALEFPDAQIATHTIEQLRSLKDDKFFIAMGLHKPHLPFVFPSEYLDWYSGNIPLANHTDATEGLPDLAWSYYNELRAYGDIEELDLPVTPGNWMPAYKARQMRRAYWAATSFIDAQIGRVLVELDALGLAETTAVVIASDHGFHLGDLGEWCKQTNFEPSNRVVLLVRDPSLPQSRDLVVNENVELLDVYPSLVEMTGHSVPEYLEGKSLKPLMQEPGFVPPLWHNASFSQTHSQHARSVMGFTVRTTGWRYTEWVAFDNSAGEPLWHDLRGTELYDHRNDAKDVFGGHEEVNLADKSGYEELRSQLRLLLHSQSAITPVPPV